MQKMGCVWEEDARSLRYLYPLGYLMEEENWERKLRYRTTILGLTKPIDRFIDQIPVPVNPFK